MAIEWQTLATLARETAALPKKGFEGKYSAPFLLELNPESGEISTGETAGYDPSKINGELSPSLNSSKILHFGEGGAFTIGRSDGCNITCNHETVSETHCSFAAFGSIWAIKDEGSKNGTFVNGRKMKVNEQSPLKFGTKIMLGSAQFLFLSSEGCYELVQELSKEPRIRPRSLGKLLSDFKQAGAPDQIHEQFPGPFLVVQAPSGRDPAAKGSTVTDSNTITLSAEELKKSVNKNVTDAVFDLSKHNLVRIGRATVTQIHLPLGAISNLHAALVRDDGKWKIQDLGAKNGTYLWGDRLDGTKELESGTEIMLGNIKSMFFETEQLLAYATHRDSLV